MTDEPDVQKIAGTTPDFQTELAKKLQELVPEAIADGKVDTQKLKELLDSDSADDSERFGLFWPGKKRAMRAAQEPTTATLKPAKNESKDWDTTQNLFIEGDNLEVLKVLQKHYHNKIKMIYIDPPYNTGKDFVYPDNYKEGLASYLEFTNQVDKEGRKLSTNSDTDGRYHSNWLNMMYPRLKLARNLLTNDGAIFISIDENEASNLKKICDEIFGENNFISQAGWQKVYSPKNQARYLSNDYEFVLIYARNIDDFQIGLLPRTEEMNGRYSNPDNDPRGDWKSGDLVASGVRTDGSYPIMNPFNGKEYSVPSGKHWAVSRATMQEMLKDNRISFGKNNDSFPSSKQFLSEVKQGRVASSFLSYKDYGHTDEAKKDFIKLFGEEGRTIFETLKPVRLMKMLALLANTKGDDIILDFFAGSGTTAQSIITLNAEDGESRRYIQVQLPEPTEPTSEAYKRGYRTVSEISLERARRAGEKVKEDNSKLLLERKHPIDVGFRVYKLADTNFTKWHTSSGTDKESIQQQLLNIRESSNDAASEEELLTEVLLKQGIALTAKVSREDIDGLSVWNIGDTTVMAYLNENIKPNLDQLRAIANKEPAKFIILEDAFMGDDELKTNLVQICKSQKIELWTV
jgi:adenine-specific DNA-methyltransferase